MGQGGFIFVEWDSIQKQYPDFQRAFAELEARTAQKCTTDWFPKKTVQQAYGYLTPLSGEQFGRTSILPALFDPNPATYGGGQFGATAAVAGFAVPPAYWRQQFTTTGHQILIQGCRSGETLPEDFKVAWAGIAFPNKNQQISEIKWQIGDRKYGRVNIEEMHSYNKPAIIFEEGFVLNEESSFELYGYVEQADYQRIVLLGAAFYKIIDKVLGTPGSVI